VHVGHPTGSRMVPSAKGDSETHQPSVLEDRRHERLFVEGARASGGPPPPESWRDSTFRSLGVASSVRVCPCVHRRGRGARVGLWARGGGYTPCDNCVRRCRWSGARGTCVGALGAALENLLGAGSAVAWAGRGEQFAQRPVCRPAVALTSALSARAVVAGPCPAHFWFCLKVFQNEKKETLTFRFSKPKRKKIHRKLAARHAVGHLQQSYS
jgi:hypothetical protein